MTIVSTTAVCTYGYTIAITRASVRVRFWGPAGKGQGGLEAQGSHVDSLLSVPEPICASVIRGVYGYVCCFGRPHLGPSQYHFEPFENNIYAVINFVLRPCSALPGGLRQGLSLPFLHPDVEGCARLAQLRGGNML